MVWVGPLHSLLVIDGQHASCMLFQQGFQLALAGSPGRQSFFDWAGGLVQGGRPVWPISSPTVSPTRAVRSPR